MTDIDNKLLRPKKVRGETRVIRGKVILYGKFAGLRKKKFEGNRPEVSEIFLVKEVKTGGKEKGGMKQKGELFKNAP